MVVIGVVVAVTVVAVVDVRLWVVGLGPMISGLTVTQRYPHQHQVFYL